uniref:BED-type domain-containing protein n=1 Tax=Chenopodium quinoa TaxID=63459 RepID=A0A803KPS6_CHEQI
MSATASSVKKKRKNSPGNRTDLGWEHGTEVDSESKKVRCKYCGVVRAGGVYRLKHHLAGTGCNVERRLQVPDDVKHKFRVLLQANA